MRFGSKREMKHTKIEIIPMIDTMFFLLVFFILASLNIIDLRGLNLDLPAASHGNISKVDPKEIKLEVEIDKAGNKTVVGAKGQPPQKVIVGTSCASAMLSIIGSQLGHPAQPKDLAEITLTISPDPDTAHENVIQVVDDARSAKLEKFSIR